MKLSLTDRFALELTDSLLDQNRVTVATRSRVASFIRTLESEIASAIKQADIDGAASRAGRIRRAEAAIRKIDRLTKVRYKQIADRISKGNLAVATRAAKDAQAAAKKVFGDAAGRKLSKTTVAKLAKDNLMMGESVGSWLEAQRASLSRAVARELRMAARRPKTTLEEVLQKVRGTATGRSIEVVYGSGRKQRVREHRGGAMHAPRNHADATARTASMAVTNAVWFAVQERVDGIIGWAAVTVLDDRTSKICIARTGAMWFLDGNPMPASTRDEPFPGPPPWHWHCRSSLVPMFERSKPKVTTFDDWLRERGDEYARKRLGPGLFDLWRSGKIALSQLIDSAGNPLTLSELSKR